MSYYGNPQKIKSQILLICILLEKPAAVKRKGINRGWETYVSIGFAEPTFNKKSFNGSMV